MALSLFPTELDSKNFHGVEVLPEEARSILRPQKDERYGFGFSLNPYRGCGHSCKYCFAREYPSLMHNVNDWGTWCAPKLNAPELLWAQRHRLYGQSVFMSTATDPYQPLEKEFRLSRRCLKVMLECSSAKLVIHTRSSLILQDIDLLKEFGSRLRVGISIPTDDDMVRQIIEPHASAIPIRWTMAERLSAAGIHVNISVTPMFPMQNTAAFVRRCANCGAKGSWAGHIRLIKSDPFRAVLEKYGWTHILEDDFGAELQARLEQTFPKHRRNTCGIKNKKPPDKLRPSIVELQPSLF
ncbi:MAG: radical SAM protein [Holophagales bacterium]|jgi:DNA repair photolyase|nr:radical SAM protein [Holophagales bacterium]